MIEGNFLITIKIPEVNEKGEVTVKGDFKVNTREELIGYLTEGVDAIERRGRELLDG